MRVPREAQAQRYLKAIRQNMEKLEALLNEPQAVGQEPRPQDRRTELLSISTSWAWWTSTGSFAC